MADTNLTRRNYFFFFAAFFVAFFFAGAFFFFATAMVYLLQNVSLWFAVFRAPSSQALFSTSSATHNQLRADYM